MAYSRTNRERVLSVACAAIVKYYSDWKKGEDYKMKLDVENQDRSYLFGRLLAIYEQIERRTYENGENREPNAIRLQAAYVNHPMQTRMVLEEAVNPYLQKHMRCCGVP
jgi:CRISPR-associated protein Csd1